MDRSREIQVDEQQENNSDSEAEFEKEMPIVFQCVKCRSILGDSLSWLSASEQLACFTLKTVTDNVQVGEKLTMSPSGVDIGSTYVDLHCTQCSQTIGKMYKTTQQSLDELRNWFSLSVPCITSYTLGSCTRTSGGQDDQVDDFLSSTKVKFIVAQLRKIQSMVLMLNTRVAAIESSFHDDEEDTINATESDSTVGQTTSDSRESISTAHVQNGHLSVTQSDRSMSSLSNSRHRKNSKRKNMEDQQENQGQKHASQTKKRSKVT